MGIYEAMFILDNREVKKGWHRTKGLVLDIIQKHGVKVLTSRKWDDRKLAFPIKKQKRGTYLLTYLEATGQEIPELRKDLQLSDFVLRHVFIGAGKIPDGEEELSQKEAETAKDEVVETEGGSGSEVVTAVGARTKAPAEPAPESEGGEAGEGEGEGEKKDAASDGEPKTEGSEEPEKAEAKS